MNPQDYNGAIGHRDWEVDEVHDLKITVQENMFEAEEDKENIGHFGMECAIEEWVGEFEKTINDIELAIKEFRSRNEGRRRASRKTKKEEIWRWNEVRESKLEQKLKYETRKKIKTPGCQNWRLQSSKAPPPTGCSSGRNWLGRCSTGYEVLLTQGALRSALR